MEKDGDEADLVSLFILVLGWAVAPVVSGAVVKKTMVSGMKTRNGGDGEKVRRDRVHVAQAFPGKVRGNAYV